MIEVNGKVYRNLQEQVYENTIDIDELKRMYGYRGPYESTADIENPVDLGLYLIGTNAPYAIYQYHELTQNYTDLGLFNQRGPQGTPGQTGPEGPQGPEGEKGDPTSISVNGTTYESYMGNITLPDYPDTMAWANITDKPTKLSDFTNDQGYITNATDELVNYYDKNAIDGIAEDYTKTADLATVALTGSYDDLTDIPTNLVTTDTEQTITANKYLGTRGNQSYVYMQPQRFYWNRGSESYATVASTDIGIVDQLNELSLRSDWLWATERSSINPFQIILTDSSNNRYHMRLPYKEGTIALTSDTAQVLTLPSTTTDLDFYNAITASWPKCIVKDTYQASESLSSERLYVPYYSLTTNGGKYYYFISHKIDPNIDTDEISYFNINDSGVIDKASSNLFYFETITLTTNPSSAASVVTHWPHCNVIDSNGILYVPQRHYDIENYSYYILQSVSTTKDISTNKVNLYGYTLFITRDNNNQYSYNTHPVSIMSNDYNDLINKPDLTVYELKSEAFSGDYDDLTNKPTLFSGDYDDLINKPDLSIYAESANLATVATTGDYDDLTNKPTIPVVPTNVSAFTNDAGYITGITSSDVTTALGYTPGTSNFSGAYADLTGKPTIPDAVSGTNDGTNWTSLTIGNDTYGLASGGGSSYTAGTGIDITNNEISIDNTVALKTDIPSNYVTTTTAQEITGEKGFAGNKCIKFFDNASTNNKMGFTCYHSAYSTNPNISNENGYLEAVYLDRDLSSSPSIVLGMYNTTNISKDRYLGFKYYSNNSGTTNQCKLMVPTKRTDATVRYMPVSINGQFADNKGEINLAIPDVSNYYTKSEVDGLIPTTATSTSTSTVTPTTTQLVFTYTDNTTETVTLMTGASVSTTTTTTLS